MITLFKIFVVVALLVKTQLMASEAEGATPPVTPQVFVLKAVPSDLFDLLTYPARVESTVNAGIYAESDGIVTKVVAPLGTAVTPRSKLIVIRHTDPVYEYAPMVFMSPVTGTVNQVQVTEGSRVTKGQPLMTVTDPKHVRLIVEVAAQDIASFKPNLKGDFLPSGQEKSVGIQVRGVSPSIDPATGTATAEMQVTKEDKLLSPGLVGQVTFKVNPHKNFVFPDFVISYKDSGTFVRIVKDGIAKRVAVKLGKKQRGLVEIIDGLHENDEVIERSSQYVADGEKVQIQASEHATENKK